MITKEKIDYVTGSLINSIQVATQDKELVYILSRCYDEVLQHLKYKRELSQLLPNENNQEQKEKVS